MASVNKVIILGNLGRDPETRHMSNGDAVTNIAVATSEKWKDKNTGEKKELTEWHRITFYRKLAEIAGQYLKKGSQVYIEGRLQTRKWADKEGVERYTTEIIADSMQMVGARPSGGSAGYGDDDDAYSAPAPQRQAPRDSGENYQRAKNGQAPARKPVEQSFDDLEDDYRSPF